MVSIKAVLCLPSSASLFADDFNERRAFTFHVESDAYIRWVDAFDLKVNIWLRRRKQIMCQNKIDDYIIDQLLRERGKRPEKIKCEPFDWRTSLGRDKVSLFEYPLSDRRRQLQVFLSVIWREERRKKKKKKWEKKSISSFEHDKMISIELMHND